MTNGKATPDELEQLHRAVTLVLINQLNSNDTLTVTDEDGKTKEIQVSSVTPAMVQAAIKFLKDNHVSTTPETDENITNLQDVLDQKRKLGNKIHLISAADAAGENNG